MKAARQAWEEDKPGMRQRRLVFLDETWASTNMTPSRGRAPRGQRCIGHAPCGHWHTTTFVCALTAQALVAPLVLDGAINGVAFRAWVEQCLAPELQPGDLEVMDNLGSHKVAGVREAIEARGAEVRYLPPYSPDLNPIEQVFSKLKTLLRRRAARTLETLWHAVGKLLDVFSPAECANYLRHGGYLQSA
nr:IS630 family transposase [Caldimonas tepidiphila]